MPNWQHRANGETDEPGVTGFKEPVMWISDERFQEMGGMNAFSDGLLMIRFNDGSEFVYKIKGLEEKGWRCVWA